MRLLTILLRYGTEAYPTAEAQMHQFFERHMAGVERDVVVVDNALTPGFMEGDDRRRLIGGDNRHREFSGFDRAIQHVGARIRAYDLVHFVTDAFHTLYVDYLTRFDTSLLRAIAGRGACVGHIDCYNEPIEIQGFHSQHWIRSCYFFMTPSDVAALGSFVSVRDAGRFFSGNPAAPFRSDAPLSRRYQAYLIDWLTGGSLGQGVEWHSSFVLDAATLPRFEQKSAAIMNEHLLGARLRAMGCRLVDVTWLSSSLRRAGAADVDWNAEWRHQLANRDQAAMVLSG